MIHAVRVRKGGGAGAPEQTRAASEQTGDPPGANRSKAEGVCQSVLPGVRTCAPFEEGILHLWMGGLVARPLGWG